MPVSWVKTRYFWWDFCSSVAPSNPPSDRIPDVSPCRIKSSDLVFRFQSGSLRTCVCSAHREMAQGRSQDLGAELWIAPCGYRPMQVDEQPGPRVTVGLLVLAGHSTKAATIHDCLAGHTRGIVRVLPAMPAGCAIQESRTHATCT